MTFESQGFERKKKKKKNYLEIDLPNALRRFTLIFLESIETGAIAKIKNIK